MSETKLAGYVITFNEAHQITRCLKSMFELTDHVVVLDSGSTDGTQDIAKSLGAIVAERPFDDYSSQRNAALDLLNASTGAAYVVTLDADEWFDDSAIAPLQAFLSESSTEIGVIRRLVRFDGRLLRYGSRRSVWLPRVFPSQCRYEERGINEHVEIPPKTKTVQLEGFVEHADIDSWSRLIDKHNSYTDAEAMERFADNKHERTSIKQAIRAPHLRNRWLRETLASRLPAVPVARFLYDYVVRGGCLDGRAGLRRAVFDSWVEMVIEAKFDELGRQQDMATTHNPRPAEMDIADEQ